MFTGIIKQTGRVLSLERNKLKIKTPELFLSGVKTGDSVAIDGACMTVVKKSKNFFVVDVIPETSRLTTLSGLKAGDRINLEKSLRAGERLDGHIVLGHVDDVGKVVKFSRKKNDILLKIKAPKALNKFIARKGCVAVNGTSLTVASAQKDAFTVALIPHTLKKTNLSDLKVGDNVNLEIDVVARYIDKLKNET